MKLQTLLDVITLDNLLDSVSKIIGAVADSFDTLSGSFGIILLVPVVITVAYSVIGLMKTVLFLQKKKNDD